MTKKFVAGVDEDVFEAEASDLVADSQKAGSLKIDKVLTLQIVSTFTVPPAAEYVEQIEHGMGFIPAFVALFNYDGDISSAGHPIWYKVPFFQGDRRSIKVFADDTYIYASAVTLEAGTYDFKVTVFREDLEGPFFNTLPGAEI